ncbi:MAG: hypothetical protein AAE983_00885 [Thermoplasmataceae archaeon]
MSNSKGNGLDNAFEFFHLAKEQPKKETEEQIAIRKEICRDWSVIEPELIEMAHKLEDHGLIENMDYILIKGRIFNLSLHFDEQQFLDYDHIGRLIF